MFLHSGRYKTWNNFTWPRSVAQQTAFCLFFAFKVYQYFLRVFYSCSYLAVKVVLKFLPLCSLNIGPPRVSIRQRQVFTRVGKKGSQYPRESLVIHPTLTKCMGNTYLLIGRECFWFKNYVICAKMWPLLLYFCLLNWRLNLTMHKVNSSQNVQSAESLSGSFSKLTCLEPMSELIYNPITAMGFSAMFTFQLDNTKR